MIRHSRHEGTERRFQSALWAATYPHRACNAETPDQVAGAARRHLDRAGLSSAVSPDRIFELLRIDAEWVSTAASSEQREAMGLERPDKAVWASTPEGLDRERQEKQAALERYKQMWGRYPA